MTALDSPKEKALRLAAEAMRYTLVLTAMGLVMRTHLFFVDRVYESFYLSHLLLAGPALLLALPYVAGDLLPSLALAVPIALIGDRRWIAVVLVVCAFFFYANVQGFLLFSSYIDIRAAVDNFDWNLVRDLLNWGGESSGREFSAWLEGGKWISNVKKALVFLLYLLPLLLIFVPRRRASLYLLLLVVGASIYFNRTAGEWHEDLATSPLVVLFSSAQYHPAPAVRLHLDETNFPYLPRPEPLVEYDRTRRYNFVVFLMESVSKRAFDQAHLPFMKGLIAEKGVEFLGYYCEKPLSIAAFYSLLVGEGYYQGEIQDLEAARARILHSRDDFTLYYFHSGDLAYKGQKEVMAGRLLLFDMHSPAMSPQFKGSKSRAQDRYLHHLLELELPQIAHDPAFGLFFSPIMTHAPYYTYDPQLDERLSKVERFFYGLEEQDRVFQSIYETLAQSGLLKNAFVVIASDHGEGLGEREFANGHGMKIYQEHVHLPLAIIPPPGAAIRQARDGRTLTTCDLNILLRSLMGEAPGDETLLTSYRAFVPLEAISGAQLYGVVDEKYKFIYRAGQGRFSIYDLQDDPGERSDIYREGDGLAEAYKAKFFSVFSPLPGEPAAELLPGPAGR